MPISLFQGEEREYILNTLSSEIDFLYSKIEEMYQTDTVFNDGVKLLEKFNQPFTDDSQLYRRTFAFIAVLAMENNIVLKDLLLSKSEKEDLTLIKNGIITMQEGCKKLIGFYNNKGGDQMIKNSLLYKVYIKFEINSPEIYKAFVKHVGIFRDKLQKDNTKRLRDTLVHFQEGDGVFNPFTFIEDIFKIEVNDVFSILFDYCIFLRYTAQSLGILMKLDRI
jgi:hypothetical protein